MKTLRVNLELLKGGYGFFLLLVSMVFWEQK